MCFSYSFNVPINNVLLKANAKSLDFINWQPKANAVSGDCMPLMTNEFPQVIQYFKWGLVPTWAKNIAMGNNMYNTKMENLVEKDALQAIFRYKRCLVPATAFTVRLLKDKTQTKEIIAPENNFFFMCGLWDVWGEGLQSFSIITHQPKTEMEYAIPYIININDKDKWLSKKSESLLLFRNLRSIIV
jgi:putative SOS response-associated peptidase YedK